MTTNNKLYYFVSADGEILGSIEADNLDHVREEAQDWAEDTGVEVWVLVGEPTGIRVQPSGSGLAGLIARMGEAEMMRRWNNGEGLPGELGND